MKEIVSRGSLVFSLKVLAAASGLAFNLLLARLLGAEKAGIYYLSLSIIMTGALFGRMGLDNALLRFTASNAAKGKWTAVAGVYRQGIKIASIASIFSTVVLWLCASWISQTIFSKPMLTEPLRLMAFSILPLSLANLYAEMLKGLEKIGLAILIQSVGIPLLSLPLLAFLGNHFGVLGAAIAYLASTILVLLFGVLIWQKTTPQIRGLRGSFDSHLLITTSLPLFWIALMNMVMNITDTIMLGIWTNSEVVGLYGVITRIVFVNSMLLIAINSVVAPKFAVLYSQRDQESLYKLVQGTTRLMVSLGALIFLLFLLFSKSILGLFGPDFVSGSSSLLVLAFGQFIIVATGPVAFLLMMTGHEKTHRNIVVFSGILNIILNGLLIPLFGLWGAVYGTTLSLSTKNILAYYYAKKTLRLSTLGRSPNKTGLNDRQRETP